MKIIDIFDDNGKALNEILEEYIMVALHSIIDSEKTYNDYNIIRFI